MEKCDDSTQALLIVEENEEKGAPSASLCNLRFVPHASAAILGGRRVKIGAVVA